MHYFFPLLSLLAWIGGHYANGILIWLSFLTLGIWGILALNALQMIVQLFTRHRRKAWFLCSLPIPIPGYAPWPAEEGPG